MNVVKSLYRGATGAFGRGALVVALASVGVVAAAAEAQADSNNLAQRRREAQGELRQFFNAEVKIDASLKSKRGPEAWDNYYGGVFGCPSTSGLDTPAQLSVNLLTGNSTSWAGDLDGLNVSTRSPDGERWMGVAVPGNAAGSDGTPVFRFRSLEMDTVRRPKIDRAFERFDECAGRLPPGDYGANGLAERCPYPTFDKNEVGQTCIVSTDGQIVAQNGDGSYAALFERTYSCDFVQYKTPGPGSTSFTGCYFATYEGKATVTSLDSSSAARQQVRAMKRAQKRCAGLRGAAGKRCVSREMGRR